MIAIGADVHKRMCMLAVQGKDGEVSMLPSMENTRANWLRLLGRPPPDAEIALEVSTSGHFAVSFPRRRECVLSTAWPPLSRG